jgi:hypothetical protein
MLEPVPTLFGRFAAALPALTQLRAASVDDAYVSGLTGLRRLEVRATWYEDEGCYAVEGLSGLTALEDLSLECATEPLAPASDLTPLTALTRLAMTHAPADLGSSPVAARLRRLELQAFGAPGDAPGGGATGAAALAALARGAPLLERLRICVEDHVHWNARYDLEGVPLPSEHPDGVAFSAALGPGVAWPSLTHLEVTPWAAVLLAACTFPRLSRLVARICGRCDDGAIPHAQLQAALAALAPKARDHVALRVEHSKSLLAGPAAVPGVRHLSWAGTAAPSIGDWARLAQTLQSLELRGPLDACGKGLAALTGLTRLRIFADGGRAPAEGAPARVACVIARLPRLAHLRLSSRTPSGILWGSPEVAAALARCPALRLLEVEPPNAPLWRHELGPARGANPRMPRPSPTWPPFAEALRAGGCRATVRPAPDSMTGSGFAKEFEFEF